jgi:hypothetical protein
VHEEANLFVAMMVGSNTHSELTRWSFGVKVTICQMAILTKDHCVKCKCVVVPRIQVVTVGPPLEPFCHLGHHRFRDVHLLDYNHILVGHDAHLAILLAMRKVHKDFVIFLTSY